METIRLAKSPQLGWSLGSGDYERLVEAARKLNTTTYVIVLLGRESRVAMRRDELDWNGATWTSGSASVAWNGLNGEAM